MLRRNRRATDRPSPRAVIWGSIALFAVLFVLLSFQLLDRGVSRAGAPTTIGARTETDAPPSDVEDDDNRPDEESSATSPPVVTSSS